MQWAKWFLEPFPILLEPLPDRKVETWRESRGFPGWSASSELSLAGMDFALKSRAKGSGHA